MGTFNVDKYTQMMNDNAGTLDMYKTNAYIIPDNLTVKKDMILAPTITKLPKNLTVMGTLKISSSNIDYVPEDCVLGNLDCSEFMKKEFILPNNIHINGDINLSKSYVILPNNFTVNGDLILNYYYIGCLPHNLTVNGNLYITGGPIRQLPDSLIVHGNLIIKDSF